MAVECSRNSIPTCKALPCEGRRPRRGARPRPRDNRSQQPTRFQIYMCMYSGSRSYTMKFSIGWILFVIDGSSDLAETNASMRRTLPSLSYHKHNAHGQHSKETSGGIPPHGSCLQRHPTPVTHGGLRKSAAASMRSAATPTCAFAVAQSPADTAS